MRTKFLSVLAVTAILFASCSSDDEATTEVNDGRVLFSSGVNSTNLKVGGTGGDQWTLNDPIGIYMRDNTMGKDIVSENIEYKATSLSNGDKNATFTSTTPIYYPVNTPAKVDFVAYHPYQASVSNYVYKIDVSSAKQASQTGIDLMRAYADGIGNAGYDKTNNSPVNLVFDHQLAKVIINVTAGTEVAPDLNNLTVNIKGMNTTADFDLNGTNGITNEGGQLDITPYRTPSTDTFEAILLPVALTTQTIEFTVGGNTYKWTINSSSNSNNVTSLVKGKIYTFNVTLKKTGMEVIGTISPWESAGAPTGGTAS
jgi:hypothetical protein